MESTSEPDVPIHNAFISTTMGNELANMTARVTEKRDIIVKFVYITTKFIWHKEFPYYPSFHL